MGDGYDNGPPWHTRMQVRQAAAQTLIDLKVCGPFEGAYPTLEKLLGCNSIFKLNAEQARKLELLAGPHGAAIYRAMMARKRDE